MEITEGSRKTEVAEETICTFIVDNESSLFLYLFHFFLVLKIVDFMEKSCRIAIVETGGTVTNISTG